MSLSHRAHRVGVVLFDQFEFLDVFGPVEMYRLCDDRFDVVLVGPEAGPVRSAQGPYVVADSSYTDAPSPEIVLVPGGRGTRRAVGDRDFLSWLVQWSAPAEFVTSVCTGSGILAASGLLDDHRATSNKAAFDWARSQSDRVSWIWRARWVESGNRWTSSGVSAGIDMSLTLIAHLHGVGSAEEVATQAEYEWHRDATWDPFAAQIGSGPG